MRVDTNSLLFTFLFSAMGGSALAEDTATTITPAQIEKIAPKSKSCDDAKAKDECATADTAAQSISASFKQYDVSSRAEQAAVIGLMAFETEEFQYNRNHSPGVPGQGTRNMQAPKFNVEYAQSIPDIRDEVCKANGDESKILDILVAEPEYDFGSGAWFLTAKCDDDVRKQLQSGSEEGWAAYITKCVETEANEDRKGYWEKAVQALE